MPRRRHRTPSLETEIRVKAKQIMADQMAEAMTAATLIIVSRKLDEIRALLQNAGFPQIQTPIVLAANRAVNSSIDQSGQRPVIEHPCVQCGREGVRKTKPNKFNRQGSWYCLAHAKLAQVAEYEDKVDAGFNQGSEILKQQANLQVVAQQPVQPAGSSNLAEAMASLSAEEALGVR